MWINPLYMKWWWTMTQCNSYNYNNTWFINYFKVWKTKHSKEIRGGYNTWTILESLFSLITQWNTVPVSSKDAHSVKCRERQCHEYKHHSVVLQMPSGRKWHHYTTSKNVHFILSMIHCTGLLQSQCRVGFLSTNVYIKNLAASI